MSLFRPRALSARHANRSEPMRSFGPANSRQLRTGAHIVCYVLRQEGSEGGLTHGSRADPCRFLDDTYRA